jgi:hypothetical protein
MSDSRPLHVQVAEAIGWTVIREGDTPGEWWGNAPGSGLMLIPRYDSSWCSCGALTERFKIGVTWDHEQWIAQHATEEGHDQYAGGERPTEAIAKLVVHLSKEGKLKV